MPKLELMTAMRDGNPNTSSMRMKESLGLASEIDDSSIDSLDDGAIFADSDHQRPQPLSPTKAKNTGSSTLLTTPHPQSFIVGGKSTLSPRSNRKKSMFDMDEIVSDEDENSDSGNGGKQWPHSSSSSSRPQQQNKRWDEDFDDDMMMIDDIDSVHDSTSSASEGEAEHHHFKTTNSDGGRDDDFSDDITDESGDDSSDGGNDGYEHPVGVICPIRKNWKYSLFADRHRHRMDAIPEEDEEEDDDDNDEGHTTTHRSERKSRRASDHEQMAWASFDNHQRSLRSQRTILMDITSDTATESIIPSSSSPAAAKKRELIFQGLVMEEMVGELTPRGQLERFKKRSPRSQRAILMGLTGDSMETLSPLSLAVKNRKILDGLLVEGIVAELSPRGQLERFKKRSLRSQRTSLMGSTTETMESLSPPTTKNNETLQGLSADGMLVDLSPRGQLERFRKLSLNSVSSSSSLQSSLLLEEGSTSSSLLLENHNLPPVVKIMERHVQSKEANEEHELIDSFRMMRRTALLKSKSKGPPKKKKKDREKDSSKRKSSKTGSSSQSSKPKSRKSKTSDSGSQSDGRPIRSGEKKSKKRSQTKPPPSSTPIVSPSTEGESPLSMAEIEVSVKSKSSASTTQDQTVTTAVSTVERSSTVSGGGGGSTESERLSIPKRISKRLSSLFSIGGDPSHTKDKGGVTPMPTTPECVTPEIHLPSTTPDGGSAVTRGEKLDQPNKLKRNLTKASSMAEDARPAESVILNMTPLTTVDGYSVSGSTEVEEQKRKATRRPSMSGDGSLKEKDSTTPSADHVVPNTTAWASFDGPSVSIGTEVEQLDKPKRKVIRRPSMGDGSLRDKDSTTPSDDHVVPNTTAWVSFDGPSVSFDGPSVSAITEVEQLDKPKRKATRRSSLPGAASLKEKDATTPSGEHVVPNIIASFSFDRQSISNAVEMEQADRPKRKSTRKSCMLRASDSPLKDTVTMSGDPSPNMPPAPFTDGQVILVGVDFEKSEKPKRRSTKKSSIIATGMETPVVQMENLPKSPVNVPMDLPPRSDDRSVHSKSKSRRKTRTESLDTNATAWDLDHSGRSSTRGKRKQKGETVVGEHNGDIVVVREKTTRSPSKSRRTLTIKVEKDPEDKPLVSAARSRRKSKESVRVTGDGDGDGVIVEQNEPRVPRSSSISRRKPKESASMIGDGDGDIVERNGPKVTRSSSISRRRSKESVSAIGDGDVVERNEPKVTRSSSISRRRSKESGRHRMKRGSSLRDLGSTNVASESLNHSSHVVSKVSKPKTTPENKVLSDDRSRRSPFGPPKSPQRSRSFGPEQQLGVSDLSNSNHRPVTPSDLPDNNAPRTPSQRKPPLRRLSGSRSGSPKSGKSTHAKVAVSVTDLGSPGLVEEPIPSGSMKRGRRGAKTPDPFLGLQEKSRTGSFNDGLLSRSEEGTAKPRSLNRLLDTLESPRRGGSTHQPKQQHQPVYDTIESPKARSLSRIADTPTADSSTRLGGSIHRTNHDASTHESPRPKSLNHMADVVPVSPKPYNSTSSYKRPKPK